MLMNFLLLFIHYLMFFSHYIIASYDTAGVIAILYDFVNDADDPNIRAVACLALAKTGNPKMPIKISLLQMIRYHD